MQILRRGVVMPAAVAAAILATSCSSSPTPPLDIALTGIAATAPVPSPAPAQQPALTDTSPVTSKTTQQITPQPSGPVMALATPAGGVVTPQTNPAAFSAPVTPAPTAVPATGTQVADTASAQDKPLDPASARVAQAAAAPVPAPQPAAKTAETSNAAEPAATASSKAPDTTVANAAPSVANDANSQPRGFLASLFSQNASATPASAKAARDEIKPVRVASVAAPVEKTPAARQRVSITPATKTELSALPGVNAENLFEIRRRSGGNDVSDVDANEEAAPPVRVASVTGLARLAPNGLAVQTDNVDVACLKPQLVRVLKNIESHYRRKVVVTSGYRSPSHNKRARGAKNSLHMYCAAADIQIAGVSKWQLASYLRTMPGRGGVGTYCHTESVHVDIGPERDWNWRCRRSR